MKNIFVKADISVIVFLFVFNFSCIAQDTVKQTRVLFNGYVKDMQTVIFQNIKNDWTTSNLIHNRLNLTWLISPSFTASASMRNRFLYGDMLRTFPGYNKTFEQDNGIIDLSKNIADQSSFLLNIAFDRAWLGYSNDKFQITLGRQRINWGQTFVWNPNDIFNSYAYFDFDYEEKPGSDAIRFQYFTNPTSVFETAVKFNNKKKFTAAALYRFNKWGYDFQFLGGMVDQCDYVIGTGWSGQILKGGFRGEASYFHPHKKFADTSGILAASFGYDYTFKNSIFLQFEALYNGYNDTLNILSLGQMNNNSMSAKNIFLSDFSFFLSSVYPVTPLINISLSAILNPKFKMYFIVPNVTISLKDNIELSFLAQIFQYYGKGNSSLSANFIFARLKGSF